MTAGFRQAHVNETRVFAVYTGLRAEDGGGMPTYYFDSDDGDRVFRDSDGAEMPDRSDAMEQALDLLRDLSHGLSAEGSTVLSCTVREAGEAVVYRVTMVVEGRSASAPPV